ncbi:hypothetical protein ASZ78_009103, partial [Callipepla squamata]
MQQKLPGWDTSQANSVSVPQGPSAINTSQGNLGIRSVTSRDEGQIPVPADSRTTDVGVQVEPQELEENAAIEQAGHPSDALQLPSLALSTLVSESYGQDLAARDTSVTAENVSLLTYVCPESVESEEEEGQDEVEADAAEAGSVPPSGSGSSPGELLTQHGARPRGTLRVQGTAARAERRAPAPENAIPVPHLSTTMGRHVVSPGRAAAGSPRAGGQLAVPGHHAPAVGAICSRIPWLVPRTQRMQQKLPGWDTSQANSVSVPQDPSAINTTQGNLGIRSVTSRDEGQIPVPADSRTTDVGVQVEPQELEENAAIEQAGHPSDALQLPSLSPSTVVSESYGQDLEDTVRVNDPRLSSCEPCLYSLTQPAISRISEEAMNDPTSSEKSHFLATCDSHYVQRESFADADSDAITDDSMLDARDTSVTAENVSLLTYICPESMEGEEEEGQDEVEADAAEAGSMPPSRSGSPPGEVKSTPSTSPVADGPRAEGHLPTCEEGAEAVACQQEVSQCPRLALGVKLGSGRSGAGLCTAGRCLVLSNWQPAPCTHKAGPPLHKAWLAFQPGAQEGDPVPGTLAPTASPASGIQGCALTLPTQVSAEDGRGAQINECFRETPEDGP